MVGKESKRQKLPRLKQFISFLSKRHVLLGLLTGFVWAFSAPFIITSFRFLQDLPQEAKWVLFFPLHLSYLLTTWMVNLELVDPLSWSLIIWIISIFVGMFSGAVFSHSVNRIRVWRRARNSHII